MLQTGKYDTLLNQIAKDAKIAIYGTESAAITLKNEIKDSRKDIQLAFFLDNYNTGNIDNIQIYSPFELKNLPELFDVVIVASYDNADEMTLVLNSLGVENILYVPKELIFGQNEYPNIPCHDYANYLNYIESKDIFDDEEQSKLYEIIFNARCDKTELYKALQHAYPKYKEKFCLYPTKLYIDYINKDAIKTVLDCGAHNCLHSIIFSNKFKNIEKIYSFEPLYNKFKHELYDKIINAGGKIEIVKKAVWNEATTLEFREYTDDHTISSCLHHLRAKNERPCSINTVPAVRIDDFVKDNNIEKVDFIKMDLENAEQEALHGAEKTMTEHRPQLAISIYHSMNQFTGIPTYLNKLLDDYVFKVEHYQARKLSDTILYGIPKELYK